MTQSSTKLKVGVVLESLEVPAWQYNLINSVRKSDYAAIVLLIVAKREKGSPERLSRPHSNQSVAYRAFKKIEDENRNIGPDACALSTASDLFQGIDRVSCKLTTAEQCSSPLVESVRARDLDILIVLAEPGPLTSSDSLARLGVWYFEADGYLFSPSDGSMVGFKELLGRRPYLSSSLQILESGLRATRIAYQTVSAIDYLSHIVTRNEHLWKCSTFVLRALKKCHELGGETYLRSLQIAGTPKPQVAPQVQIFAFPGYFFWRVYRKIYHLLFMERWILLFGPRNKQPSEKEFTALMPPTGRFWADPHAIVKDGLHHVFFEDASKQTGIGHISVMTSLGDGHFTAPKPALRRPYHLSYPFLFEWRGTLFLIPESAENRTVELYRCVKFPDQWEFELNLMENISAYDATLLEHNGRWWLFANVREHDGASTWDELCIFHADRPDSRNWQPHRSNPVVSDVRRARPAGSMFSENGHLYRPSQDSSQRYGKALHINEVIELNENAYREVSIATIEPNWHRSILAVHSYSRAGQLTFVDAIHREPKLRFLC